MVRIVEGASRIPDGVGKRPVMDMEVKGTKRREGERDPQEAIESLEQAITEHVRMPMVDVPTRREPWKTPSLKENVVILTCTFKV